MIGVRLASPISPGLMVCDGLAVACDGLGLMVCDGLVMVCDGLVMVCDGLGVADGLGDGL